MGRDKGLSIIAPPLYQRVIRRRESLYDRLRQASTHRLILVQADPGYGKTAFLASFAREYGGPDGVPTAWLTLNRSHTDRVQLLMDLALSVHSVRPDIGTVTLDALKKSKDVLRRWDYFLELFCQEMREADARPLLIVLDQYERIAASPSSRNLVECLAKKLPTPLTLLVSTRPLPDQRFTGRSPHGDDVLELSTEDLRFTADETGELFQQMLGFPLPSETAEQLVMQANGCAAAIQAACAWSLRSGGKDALIAPDDRTDFPDYVCQEILRYETTETKPFLKRTAMAESLSPELGCLLARDSEALRALIRLQNGEYPGLTAETEHGIFYTHNPVFRNHLLKGLENEACEPTRGLHLELADFYAASRQWDLYLHHLIEASEYQRASELVASLAEKAISSNRLETLARWIDAFPTDQRSLQPWLQLYRGVIYRVDREWEKALALYNWAADAFREQGDLNGLSRALWYASQVLAYRRNQQLAILLGREAMSYLPPSDKRSRAWILHTVGNSCFDLGNTTEALRCHREALDLFVQLDDARGQMMQSQAIGWALHRLGHIGEAQQEYLRALTMQAENGDINSLCWLRAGISHLRAIRGEHADAVAELTEIVEIARRHFLRPAETFSLACLAEIHLDSGNYKQAEVCCREGLEACDEFDDDAPQIELRLRLIEIELRTSDSATGTRKVPGLSIAEWVTASNLEITRITHNLLKTAILLAEGRHEDAEQWAREARTQCVKLGARYQEAQACYLLARVSLVRGEIESSAALVKELIDLIESEGYVSFLLREPEATCELLVNAFRQSPARDRIASLLMKLSALKAEVAAPLLGCNVLLGPDRVMAVRDKLTAEAMKIEIAARNGSPPSEYEPLPETDISSLAREQVRGVSVEVRALGPIRVSIRGRLITDRAWRTYKAKELFAYLLTRGDRSATRDELIEALWPELSIESAVSNFHFTVHSIRHALEPDLPPRASSRYLTLSGRLYQLELPQDTWIDMDEFKECLSSGLRQAGPNGGKIEFASLERAVNLYRGDCFSDLYVDWVEPLRQDLLKAYLDSLGRLASQAFLRQNFDSATYYAKLVLEKDNYLEASHRTIMRCAHETGNTASALRHYGELAKMLERDLDTRPEAETHDLYNQIKQGTYQRIGPDRSA